jgi:hypothetical protein
MVAHIHRFVFPLLFCLVGLQSLAQTAEPDAAVVSRWESVTVNEGGMDLLIRFDRPINHERSWLSLLHDGKSSKRCMPGSRLPPMCLRASGLRRPATTSCTGSCAPRKVTRDTMGSFR